jgi:hypothetical protein
VSADHPALFGELVARMEARSSAGAPRETETDLGSSAAALQALGYAGD